MRKEAPGGRLGLRGRLTASIALILLLTLAAAFAATYRGTGNDLRQRTDDDLRETAATVSAALARQTGGAKEVKARAEALAAANAFGPSSQVVAVRVPGAGLATNQPELLGLAGEARSDHDRESERTTGQRILGSGSGYETITTEEAGDVRVLTEHVRLVGGSVATVRVGESLVSVDRALDGLRRILLLIGAIALAAGVGAAYLLASRTARPLRRMARTAAKIDSGDLDLRMGAAGPSTEAQRLATTFDHMLDRLEQAFARQREFVSDASHELRTPLTVVRGQIEVLARQEDPTQEDVDRVSRLVGAAVDRMERLVDDLLLLAKTDEGLQLDLGPVGVDDLFEAHVEAFDAVADRHFTVDGPTEITIRADGDRTGQILSILISNAIDHTDEGGRIGLSAEAQGARARIRIDDDGPGIPASERSAIFDRFHRSDASRTRRRGGSGLGLAIAKALVEAQGGHIRATDSAMGGARLEFDLPLSPGHTSPPAP